ncbi:MAG: molybdenum cofactor biosynthesis protein MoaE [Candidatus Bathyarchaeia archaeon]
MVYKYVHKKGSLTLDDLIRRVKEKEDFYKAGAICIFVGVVRGENPTGERVKKLEIEAYEEKADEVLSNICRDLKRREGIVDVQIHHFQGEFNVGEDLVYVIVAGSHRENVFLVLREAVERYKKEAPLFKKEFIVNREGRIESYWTAEKGVH